MLRFKKNHYFHHNHFILSLLVLISFMTGCVASSTEQDSKTVHSQTSESEIVLPSTGTSTKDSTPITDLTSLTYQGNQTITLNENQPTFTKEDLDTSKGAWERYGDLDALNRATSAEALLHISQRPNEKREGLHIDPTGWRNKKVKGGYLYNRSHLIGFQFTGQNNNIKNLITGTRQLNSPEMLRHEMDIKDYIDNHPDDYVRYSVTPIFRENELVARGVHLMAQSVNTDDLAFNVYIFNIQDGVTINYADGSSTIDQNTENKTQTEASSSEFVLVTGTGSKYHKTECGKGSYTQISLAEAQALGLEPCKKCYQ